MKKDRVRSQNQTLTEISVLIAFVFILGLTPFGYIKFGVIEITLITLPVIVGAITCGSTAGLTLGTIFGITSFLQGVMGVSVFGATLFNINPLYFFLLTIPTRALMGWLTGMFFKLMKKNILCYSATGLVGSLLNTVFFMGALIALFWNTNYIQGLANQVGATSILTFVVAFVGANGLIEAVACTILTAAICKALSAWFKS